MKLLLGQIRIPTKDEMHQEVREDLEMRQNSLCCPPSLRHLFIRIDLTRDYFRRLEVDGQLEPLKPAILDLLEEVVHLRNKDSTGYKLRNYRVIDEAKFEQIDDVLSQKVIN